MRFICWRFAHYAISQHRVDQEKLLRVTRKSGEFGLQVAGSVHRGDRLKRRDFREEVELCRFGKIFSPDAAASPTSHQIFGIQGGRC